MYDAMQMKVEPKGPEASRLRQRKFELLVLWRKQQAQRKPKAR